jgi:MFS family permease
MTDKAHGEIDRRSFAALRAKGTSPYLLLTALVMMADSMEHVVSYWVIYKKFDSPELAGFAVISHWVPFLLFSVYTGALADRFDPRRVIQFGLLLFIGVSLGWGVLIATDTLEQWHAVILLILHGLAGVFWSPASQLLLHDIVQPKQLHSAVRLLAMARTVGLLLGPAVGGLLLLIIEPATALFLNALLYLPLTIWLMRAPYGPKFRPADYPKPAATRGFSEVIETLRAISGNTTIVSMIAIAGAASFFIGFAYQAQMGAYAGALGHVKSSFGYSALLVANALGAVLGGLILEWRSLLPARPGMAFILVGLWAASLGGFALTSSFPVALVLLFIAGFLYLAYTSMAQTLVQMNAPPEIRGRVIGVYSMAALGLMTFSGMTIGLLGGVVGVHWSLGGSAIALFVVTLLLAQKTLRPGRPSRPTSA